MSTIFGGRLGINVDRTDSNSTVAMASTVLKNSTDWHLGFLLTSTSSRELFCDKNVQFALYLSPDIIFLFLTHLCVKEVHDAL